MKNEIVIMAIEIIFSVIAALVSAYLIPYLKSQTKTKQQEEVLKIVEVAVHAAEQTLKSGTIKKREVTQFVTDWLNERGLKFTEGEVDRLIESAVFNMNTVIKELKTPIVLDEESEIDS